MGRGYGPKYALVAGTVRLRDQRGLQPRWQTRHQRRRGRSARGRDGNGVAIEMTRTFRLRPSYRGGKSIGMSHEPNARYFAGGEPRAKLFVSTSSARAMAKNLADLRCTERIGKRKRRFIFSGAVIAHVIPRATLADGDCGLDTAPLNE